MKTRSAFAMLIGTTSVQGLVAPLPMRGQAVDAFTGTWRGTLTTARAPLRLSFRLSKRPDGIYLGMFTSLDEGGAQASAHQGMVGDRLEFMTRNTRGQDADGALDRLSPVHGSTRTPIHTGHVASITHSYGGWINLAGLPSRSRGNSTAIFLKQ